MKDTFELLNNEELDSINGGFIGTLIICGAAFLGGVALGVYDSCRDDQGKPGVNETIGNTLQSWGDTLSSVGQSLMK